MANHYIMIFMTAANKDEAEKIVQTLLQKKLIACANVIKSVKSHFFWKGTIDQGEECLVIMKSRMDLFEQIAEHVKGLHSYEVPEVLALPIVAGSEAYLRWMDEVLLK